MKRRKSNPKKLIQVINEISQKNEFFHKNRSLMSLMKKDVLLWIKWEEIVGDRLAKNASPHKLTNNILTIKVSNSAWIQQLSFIKLDLMNKLNENLSLTIKDIMFKVDTSKREKPKNKPTDINLTEDDLLFVEENIKAIEDIETRNSFKKLMISSLLQQRTTNER